MQLDSIGGSRYVLTFIDDYSRYVTTYLLKKKSDVLSKFKEYVNFIENSTEGMKVKNLLIWNHVKGVRSDNGGEYCSQEFMNFCNSKGISHQHSNPYTPEQNGVAERYNRTLIESVRSMLISAQLPLNLWAEAVSTSVYLHNRSPTSALQSKTPYECWYGQKPDVSELRVFGCVCYYLVPAENRKKLDPKSNKAVFIGYPMGTKGYKIYNPITKTFFRSRNVTFDENKFYNFDESNESSKGNFVIFPDWCEDSVQNDNVGKIITTVVNALPQDAEVATNDNVNVNVLSNQLAHTNIEGTGDSQQVGVVDNTVQKTYEETYMKMVESLPTNRVRKPKKHFDEAYVLEEKEVVSLTSEVCEPRTVRDALKSEHSAEWKSAMDSEYSSLIQNQTWELVRRPPDINVVGNRWTFKVKRKADGSIDRFKARLVAQGFTQTHGVDYEEVFSPVARSSTIRSLFALANSNDWEIHQMDVTTAFLNGVLDCDVYMEQPSGFVDPNNENYVCKLKKGLYGLKQSARLWNNTLDKFLKSHGYIRCGADGCIYIKVIVDKNGGQFVIHVVYVDDIIPISNNKLMLEKEKALLRDKFEMVDKGEAHYVLGMIIRRNREHKLLSICQPTYLDGVLDKFNMKDCNPVTTPMEAGKHFQKRTDGEPPFDKQLYQQAVGCLTYASTSTRPDISAALGVLSQYMSDPSENHWSGIKRLLRYVKGTLNYGLKFSADDSNLLQGFTDADWAADLDTRRSTSGYIFRIGDATVSWCSKRQLTVARSTTEAEYVALSFAVQECIWLRRLLSEVGCDMSAPTVIHEDNNGAIDLSKNAKHHTRTKHIDISHHFAREKVESGEVVIVHCPTDDMLADVMTKGLARVKFQKFRDALGVCDVGDLG